MPGVELTISQDRRIAEIVAREQERLRRFIRARVRDLGEADDVLQDVFCELVETTRLMQPVDHMRAWLFQVARNRITDLFRRRKPVVSTDQPAADRLGEMRLLQDLLPSSDAGPEAIYARRVLLDELEAAVDELPEAQRVVFLAHEVEGRSFKDLAAETGLSVNTLLARKHYAVGRLRRRLQAIHDEFQNT